MLCDRLQAATHTYSKRAVKNIRLSHDIALNQLTNCCEDSQTMQVSSRVSFRAHNLVASSNHIDEFGRVKRRLVAAEKTKSKTDPRRAIKKQSNPTSSIQFSTINKMYNTRSKARLRPRRVVMNSIALTSSNIALNWLMFICLVYLTCFLFASHIRAFESVSPETGVQLNKESQASKLSLNTERADVSPNSESNSGANSLTSPASSSSQSSIVASLSSAVATAAAAAAVAAAQSSLSPNDARSLTSNAHHRHPAQRSGLHLAIKLADSIPEVPYNILHNMKKLDHAAPFYNVGPNKFSAGSTKESSQNFLTTALTTAPGNFGGAAEQLGALFKSPLWKRIADGYGDFASEFRSLFRAPGATPMKGQASSTSKLLRDISVPAILMLLASSISSEWRPARTRRKSFRPVDIAPGAVQDAFGQSTQAANHFFQNLDQNEQSAVQVQDAMSSASTPTMGSYMPATSNDWMLHNQLQRQIHNQQPLQQREQQPFRNQQVISSGQIAYGQSPSRIGQLTRASDDINLQHSPQVAMESAPAPNWVSPNQASIQLQALEQSGGLEHLQQNLDFSQNQATTLSQLQAQTPVKRSGEVMPTEQLSVHGKTASAVVKRQLFSPFSSLTSTLGLASPVSGSGQGSRFISKLFNANLGTGDDRDSYRTIMGLLTDNRGNKMSSIKRDQLSDKQRYALLGPDEGGFEKFEPAFSGQKLSSPSTLTAMKQPLLLSAMAHAISSVVSQRSEGNLADASAKSGSMETTPLVSAGGLVNTAASKIHSLLIAGNGDKLINQDDAVFMRRQPQVSALSGVAEQRDLTKLLPEAWRDVVKRTMTTVQQQANTQWKSIEGQLTNWVQDKLKTVAASASTGNGSNPNAAAPSSGSTNVATSGSGSAVTAPIGNMLASMSSTALNILGLNKGNTSSSSSVAPVAVASQAKSQTNGDEQAAGATGDHKGKLEQAPKQPLSQQQAPSKKVAALASVANLIVNSISNRNINSQSSSQSSLQKTNLSQKNQTLDSSTKTQTLGEVAASVVGNMAVSSIASKYPTLMGAQQSNATLSLTNYQLMMPSSAVQQKTQPLNTQSAFSASPPTLPTTATSQSASL